jgi:MFS family permease
LCTLDNLTKNQAAMLTASDRHNGRIFAICYMLLYFSAPVLYIGVVQASLLDRLGASKVIANLPSSTYMLGQVAPLFLSWLVPHRLERKMVVWSNLATGAVISAVFLTLAIPCATELRVAALVTQGLLQGLSGSASFVFMLQCLRRGTTEIGLANALKQTFSTTPFVAVAGSLGAQYLLKPGLPFLPYPYDFAAIHAVGALCSFGIAAASARFELAPLADEERPPFFQSMATYLREFFGSPQLTRLWIAYVFWYAALSVTSNLALYTRQAMGVPPENLSGLIMAIRFGCKAVGGYILGAISVRQGIRAGVLGTMALLGVGAGWAWAAPGAAFLFAFGLLGAGELGGAYLPNFVSSLSSPAQAARNLAVITLATPASSFAPVLHGALTERYGFWASFLLTIALAAAGLALLLTGKAKESAPVKDGRR